MDCSKVGALIKNLRLNKNMTQKQLADMLGISDKAISKWERGMGCPDVNLLNEVSSALEINIEQLLSGDITENDFVGGNMKKSKFYICQNCGNIVVSTGDAVVSCCGRKLEPQTAKKPDEKHALDINQIEDELFIESAHPMTKEHYISFIAVATGDSVKIIKLYPEWNMQVRISSRIHGTLMWYCTEHGLFYKYI